MIENFDQQPSNSLKWMKDGKKIKVTILSRAKNFVSYCFIVETVVYAG